MVFSVRAKILGFQASLQDAFFFWRLPGAEAPGYFRKSLRGCCVAGERAWVVGILWRAQVRAQHVGHRVRCG